MKCNAAFNIILSLNKWFIFSSSAAPSYQLHQIFQNIPFKLKPLQANLPGTITADFWLIIKQVLSKQEVERWQGKGGEGRGWWRGWLRGALNEHSLEKYLLKLSSSDQLLTCVVNMLTVCVFVACIQMNNYHYHHCQQQLRRYLFSSFKPIFVVA